MDLRTHTVKKGHTDILKLIQYDFLRPSQKKPQRANTLGLSSKRCQVLTSVSDVTFV